MEARAEEKYQGTHSKARAKPRKIAKPDHKNMIDPFNAVPGDDTAMMMPIS